MSTTSFYNNLNDEPYLFPIIIPTEPTLDELLRRVTGRADLENVQALKIRVISYAVSLQRLSVFIPNLSVLNLEGSVISSLRDLGCGLLNLTFLNVSNCGLRSLDGTNGFPTVETLIANDNMIENVGPCCNLINLKKISLKNNCIKDLGLLSFLALCIFLKEIDLDGNPVTQNKQYRSSMRKYITSLEILDNIHIEIMVNFNENLRSLNTDNSSLSTDSFSDEEDIKSYSSTRPDTCHITINDQLPENRNTLCSGKPVHGSIIERNRLQKQRVHSAWGYSSTSSSTSLNSSDFDYEKNFPKQLPQESIDLELGVVGLKKSKESESEKNLNSVKCIAKKWRMEFELKRDANN